MALVGCQWGYGLRDGGAATPGFMDGRSYGPFVASVGAGPVVNSAIWYGGRRGCVRMMGGLAARLCNQDCNKWSYIV